MTFWRRPARGRNGASFRPMTFAVARRCNRPWPQLRERGRETWLKSGLPAGTKVL